MHGQAWLTRLSTRGDQTPRLIPGAPLWMFSAGMQGGCRARAPPRLRATLPFSFPPAFRPSPSLPPRVPPNPAGPRSLSHPHVRRVQALAPGSAPPGPRAALPCPPAPRRLRPSPAPPPPGAAPPLRPREPRPGPAPPAPGRALAPRARQDPGVVERERGKHALWWPGSSWGGVCWRGRPVPELSRRAGGVLLALGLLWRVEQQSERRNPRRREGGPAPRTRARTPYAQGATLLLWPASRPFPRPSSSTHPGRCCAGSSSWPRPHLHGSRARPRLSAQKRKFLDVKTARDPRGGLLVLQKQSS